MLRRKKRIEPSPTIDHGDPAGWVVLASPSPPDGYAGPFLVGYGSEWTEYRDFSEAWRAHIFRGATRYACRLLVLAGVGEEG